MTYRGYRPTWADMCKPAGDGNDNVICRAAASRDHLL